MIVTKEEAKKLWCPMVNASVSVGDSMLISNRSITSRYCIADECMLWAWTEKFTEKEPCKGYGTCGLVSHHRNA